MARGAATVIELRTAVATLKRANESMKRRHREQAKIVDELCARVDILEYRDQPREISGDDELTTVTFRWCPERGIYTTLPLPKTDSTATPPAAADSGAERFPAFRLFFAQLFGRVPR